MFREADIFLVNAKKKVNLECKLFQFRMEVGRNRFRGTDILQLLGCSLQISTVRYSIAWCLCTTKLVLLKAKPV